MGLKRRADGIPWSYLLCQLIEHACADRCSVSAEDVLLSLFHLPVIFVPGRRQKREAPVTGQLKRSGLEEPPHP